MKYKSDSKTGRPRCYDLKAKVNDPADFSAWAAAALEELRARVYDQIDDLPPEALTFVPEGTTLSIAALVIHMAWGEAGWASGLADVEVPDDLHDQLQSIGQAVPREERPPLPEQVPDLIALCRRVAEEVTEPALLEIQNPDLLLPEGQHGATPRGVLMHLIWHWTYHSGQIGLLRELWGSGYTWTFGSLGEPPDMDHR